LLKTLVAFAIEIYYRTEVYERDGKQCVRVDIKHNGLAPHFGGAAWVRRGPTSVPATAEIYQQLIELRLDKVRELTKWVGKPVTVSWSNKSHGVMGPNWFACPCEVVRVTKDYSTFMNLGSKQEDSEPNEWLALSWDDAGKRLQVFVNPEMKSRPPW
jgi:hypothetical protein